MALHDRWLVAMCGGGVACFTLCLGTSIALYPGGTWFDAAAVGHSFWTNFLCDLMQTQALNGEDAGLGSLLARAGVLAMLLALVPFYALIARLESPVSSVGRVARGAGLLACVLGCAVPLVPSDLFRDAHVVAVLVAFVPGLVATTAAMLVCIRAPGVPRWLPGLAALTLGAGAIDGLLYAWVYARAFGVIDAARSPLIEQSLPALQRVATLCMLAWLMATCAHAALSSSAPLPDSTLKPKPSKSDNERTQQ